MDDVKATSIGATRARPGFALDLAAVLAPYGREGHLAVRVERMRAGARLSKGRNNGDNTWSLSPEDLEGVLYLPPDDRVHADRLALRIIELNEDGGTTLAVVEFPPALTDALAAPATAPVAAPVTAPARTVAPKKHEDVELDRLRRELAAAKELVTARDAQIAELRRAAELAAAQSTNRTNESDLTATLETARTAWDAEMQQRLDDAAAALETSRALAQAEHADELARADARARAAVDAARAEAAAKLEAVRREAEAEREALRAGIQAEHHAAHAAAEAAWRAEAGGRIAAADGRLAEAERQQVQAEQALAAVMARLERTERALNEARAEVEADDSETHRLREGLAALTASLETAKGELAQWRQRAELAVEESAKKHDSADVETALATARVTWEAELTRRLEEAAAAADAHLAASRTAWQAEEAERRVAAEARLEERIEERIAAAREEGRQSTDAAPASLPHDSSALAEAQTGRDAAERRLAEAQAARDAAERELAAARTGRDDSAREEAALAKRLERSEGALAQAKTQSERDQAELARLRQGVTDLSARLDEREADLVRGQTALEEAQRGRDVGADTQRHLLQRVLTPPPAPAPRRSRLRRFAPAGAIAAIAAAALAFYWSTASTPAGGLWPQLVSLAIGDEPPSGGGMSEPAAPATAPVTLRRATIGATGANLRAGPSTGSAVIAALPRDAEVTLIDRRGSWMQVRAVGRDGAHQEGWVYAPSVKETRSALP